MSFLNIQDPEARDAMIEDFLTLKKRLKDRNMEERSELMHHRQELEKTFAPVVVSNQQMAREIVKDLQPITTGLREINRNIGILRNEPPHLVEDYASPLKRIREAAEIITPTITPRQRNLKIGVTAVKYFKHALNNNTNDSVFGFRFKDESSQNINNLTIGDKDVHFLAGDALQIGNQIYPGTPGLYELITFKDPNSDHYTQEDLQNYTAIVKQTNVLYHENNPVNEHRWNRSNKWKFILKPIWMEVLEESEFHRTLQPQTLFADEEEEVDGSGLYLRKSGHCVKITPVEGNGLYLTPHRGLIGVPGNGLYLKHGSSIYNGEGLLLGKNSPFKNIPILNLLL